MIIYYYKQITLILLQINSKDFTNRYIYIKISIRTEIFQLKIQKEKLSSRVGYFSAT